MWLFCLLDPFIPTQIKFLATPLLRALSRPLSLVMRKETEGSEGRGVPSQSLGLCRPFAVEFHNNEQWTVQLAAQFIRRPPATRRQCTGIRRHPVLVDKPRRAACYY